MSELEPKNHQKLKLLFEEARTGQEKAKEEIYRYFYSPIYRFFFLRTKNQDDAIDLTQTSFIKFYKNLDKITETISLPSFIFTIARNTLIDHWRRKATRQTITNDEVVIIEENKRDFDNKKTDLNFYEMIDMLSEDQKEAMILRYVEDLPVKDIAEIMEKSEEAIRQLLSRGIKTLRQNKEQYEL